MLVTCAVIAIVAAFAAPALSAFVAGQREVVTLNALVGALQSARHAAVMHRRTTVVCASANGERCDDDWSAGWVAFEAPRSWSPSDPVPGPVLRHGAPARDVTVLSNRAAFRFRPHGRSTAGTLTVCGRGARSVVVSVTGRVRRGEPTAPPC